MGRKTGAGQRQAILAAVVVSSAELGDGRRAKRSDRGRERVRADVTCYAPPQAMALSGSCRTADVGRVVSLLRMRGVRCEGEGEGEVVRSCVESLNQRSPQVTYTAVGCWRAPELCSFRPLVSPPRVECIHPALNRHFLIVSSCGQCT